MGKSKMDDAAAERIRRARGDRDGFSKRAADAARRNECTEQREASSSKTSSGTSGESRSAQKSGGSGGEKK